MQLMRCVPGGSRRDGKAPRVVYIIQYRKSCAGQKPLKKVKNGVTGAISQHCLGRLGDSLSHIVTALPPFGAIRREHWTGAVCSPRDFVSALVKQLVDPVLGERRPQSYRISEPFEQARMPDFVALSIEGR